MAAEKWFEKYLRAADLADRRDQEHCHLSELTFATEAESWMNGDTRDCA